MRGNNVSSAYTICNHGKAVETPQEAHMELRSNPKSPISHPYSIFNERKILEELFPFFPRVKHPT